jgi:hypothetical protein
MTLPSRLPGLSRKVTDLAWAPRLSPNPVGQALSEAILRKRHGWRR